MPMFALANTCITLDASALGSVITAPVSQGIIGGLMIGKPVGEAEARTPRHTTPHYTTAAARGGGAQDFIQQKEKKTVFR